MLEEAPEIPDLEVGVLIEEAEFDDDVPTVETETVVDVVLMAPVLEVLRTVLAVDELLVVWLGEEGRLKLLLRGEKVVDDPVLIVKVFEEVKLDML